MEIETELWCSYNALFHNTTGNENTSTGMVHAKQFNGEVIILLRHIVLITILTVRKTQHQVTVLCIPYSGI